MIEIRNGITNEIIYQDKGLEEMLFEIKKFKLEIIEDCYKITDIDLIDRIETIVNYCRMLDLINSKIVVEKSYNTIAVSIEFETFETDKAFFNNLNEFINVNNNFTIVTSYQATQI